MPAPTLNAPPPPPRFSARATKSLGKLHLSELGASLGNQRCYSIRGYSGLKSGQFVV